MRERRRQAKQTRRCRVVETVNDNSAFVDATPPLTVIFIVVSRFFPPAAFMMRCSSRKHQLKRELPIVQKFVFHNRVIIP